MFPCEMARYIAVFSREARKYGHFHSRRAHDIGGSGSAHDTRSGPDRGLICFMFSTSERSAGTSWLPPVPVSAAAEERAAAAAAVAAPDGRPGPPDAAVEAAAGPAEAAVAAPALLFAAPGAAVVAAAQPGARVQHVRPAEGVLEAPLRVLVAAEVAQPPFAFPQVSFQASALQCPLSAGLPAEPTVSFPAFSARPRPRHPTPAPPETSSPGWSSSPICFRA